MESCFLTATAQAGRLAVMTNGHWRPGIGDPTLMGWVTTAGYAVAGMLCLWAAWKAAFASSPAEPSRGGVFWGAVGLIMLLLAICKQLDVQLWFYLTGRALARSHHLYEQRRLFQVSLIIVLGIGAIAGFASLLWLVRRAWRRYTPALVGLLFTLSFVTIRAISLHQVDVLLGRRLAGMRVEWLLEGGGILLVLASAAHAGCTADKSPEQPSAPEEALQTGENDSRLGGTWSGLE
jgi:hypothetical protein